jgi:hypothetical protein
MFACGWCQSHPLKHVGLTLEQKRNIIPGIFQEQSSMPADPNNTPEPDRLEVATDQAIAACGGDAREAVKGLVVANHFLETELEKLRAAVSPGYARLPRDHSRWTSALGSKADIALASVDFRV